MKAKTMVAVALAVACASCTASQGAAVATAVVDVSGAICTELAMHPEPAWVTFACSVASQTFQARVRREDAAMFAARHCPPGVVAP